MLRKVSRTLRVQITKDESWTKHTEQSSFSFLLRFSRCLVHSLVRVWKRQCGNFPEDLKGWMIHCIVISGHFLFQEWRKPQGDIPGGTEQRKHFHVILFSCTPQSKFSLCNTVLSLPVICYLKLPVICYRVLLLFILLLPTNIRSNLWSLISQQGYIDNLIFLQQRLLNARSKPNA